MRRIATCVAAVLAMACGADDAVDVPTGGGDGDGDGDVPSGDGDGDGDSQEPVCRTQAVANAAAGEKINAAFCFGLAYDDAYACNWFPADNAVECVGADSSYVVVFTGDDVGDVYDPATEDHMASIIQGATGSFEIAWDSGEVGECTVNGDVANLCVQL